jgi:hypothetical protein
LIEIGLRNGALTHPFHKSAKQAVNLAGQAGIPGIL